MRILLPNITTPRNIGDLAMLEVLLNLLEKAGHHPEDITIHISEPELFHPNKKEYVLRPNIYSWILFPNTSTIARFLRALYFVYAYCLTRFFHRKLADTELNLLFEDYRKADLIVFAGGGYLRSRVGFVEALQLLSILTVYIVANLYTVKKVMMPISFGPFAYEWQKKLCAYFLKHLNTVFVRERVSYDILLQDGVTDIIHAEDLVLLGEARTRVAPTQTTIGFTLREWFPVPKQVAFEREVINALSALAATADIAFQPIVQVHAPLLGDNDLAVVERVGVALRARGHRVLPTRIIQNLEEGKDIYAQLTVLLGMRMHSNILAALVGTPFVALAYEHKTIGIMKNLGLEAYCLQASDTTTAVMLAALEKLLAECEQVEVRMSQRLEEMRDATILPLLKELE